MTVVTTLDITGLTAAEYRAVWQDKDGFDRFLERRLTPAATAVGTSSRPGSRSSPAS